MLAFLAVFVGGYFTTLFQIQRINAIVSA